MTAERHSSTTDAAERAPGDAPSPRAFAVGTGYVFQTVGVVLLFSACCFWSLSSHVVEQARTPAQRWTDYLRGERLPAAVLTLGVVASVVGGAGLIAVGMGLQAERVGSGTTALLLTGSMAGIYWTLAVWLFAASDRWIGGAVAAGFAVAATILFLLAAGSASVLRRFPPPAERAEVTEEFLKELSRRPRI